VPYIRLARVELRFAEVLCKPGERMCHVLLPRCFISLITPSDGRNGLEIGLVGDEGVLGISLMLRLSATPPAPLGARRGRGLASGGSGILP